MHRNLECKPVSNTSVNAEVRITCGDLEDKPSLSKCNLVHFSAITHNSRKWDEGVINPPRSFTTISDL